MVALGTGLLAERLLPLPVTWRDPRRRRVGLAATSLGVALAAWSVAETRAVRLDDPASLVVTGPYARSRNPMYLAWDLVHLGVGVLVRSGWTLALLPPAAACLDREIRAEERVLSDRFGDAYGRYLATVPRYLRPRCRGADVVR